MIKINFEEALRRFFNNESVYMLHDDDTESLGEYFADMNAHNLYDGEFGYIKDEK